MNDEPLGRADGPPRGRPRRWVDNNEKFRAHRARKAALTAALGEMLHAVRNARLNDPVLQEAANHGDDLALVEALAAYYRARHWQRPVQGPEEPPEVPPRAGQTPAERNCQK